MRRRTLVAAMALGAVASVGLVACVDVPDSMRAQFAPAGPNDRTNYVPGRHGSAPPNTPPPMLPWDAGTPAAPVVAPAIDASAPIEPDAGPMRAPAADGGVA